MQLLYMGLFAAGIVAADQFTKFLTVANIVLYQDIDFIPGFLGLTYVQNTGAAFSSFEGMRWLFVGIFLLLTAMLVLEYFKKPMSFATFDRFCLAAIYGGALGNVIDRVRLGFVVDMISVEFIDFPVFNVADCFITCGCFAMMFSLFFINKDFWKEGKK